MKKLINKTVELSN